MEPIDFTKPVPFCDLVLCVEGRKLYCNRSLLSIWSPVFNVMFNADFKEKAQIEINLPEKSYSDLLELLQVIYPPNKAISGENLETLLKLADEYQMAELTRRCQMYLLSQRGTLDSLLYAQKYNFKDVIDRCAEHLKHSLTASVIANDCRIKHIKPEILTHLYFVRIKHLESMLDSFKRKVAGSAEKFKCIRELPGFIENTTHCSQHDVCSETCFDCVQAIRQLICKWCDEGIELTE